MVDPERLKALVARVSDETAHLRALAERPTEDLLASPDLVAAIKYRFVVAIEACIDIGEHIISSEHLQPPKEFAEVFAVLAKEGFIPNDQVSALQDMARFRNLLVHVYLEVDDRRVVEILHSRLEDFDAFKRSIARAISD